ncbi:MAG TPA: permease-like cell division protein FtsX [Bacteroidota bacterium]|nr:permease-like cell division protein FtsX [Bacteroidota bacterium]
MNLGYVIGEGLAGFRRARLAAIGSILTITISLLLLGIFYLVSSSSSRLVESIRARVEMEAFLVEPVSRQTVADIQKSLQSIQGVEHVQFISKDEAAKVFKQEFGEDIGQVLDFNPLPPSFKIFLAEKFRTSDKADMIFKRVKAVQGIDNVVYRKDLLEFLDKRAQSLDTIGLALGLLIGISAIFLVSNTIRLTIYAKRKAIQAMKLVGASRSFIRAPFMIEGMVQGMLGGLFAAGLLYYGVSMGTAILLPDLGALLSIDILFYVEVIGAGAFLGLLGSTISVRRFIGETIV